MKRGLLTTAAAVSLLGAMLVLVDWSTHPWYHHHVGFWSVRGAGTERTAYDYSIKTGRGIVVFAYETVHPAFQGDRSGFQWSSGNATRSRLMPNMPDTIPSKLGFGLVDQAMEMVQTSPSPGAATTFTEKSIILPSWSLILLFLILPAIWLWRFRRHIPPGHCQVCGYDLRASPERCPECGTEIKPENQPQMGHG